MWGGCELDDSMPRVQAKLPEHKFVSMGTSTIGSLFSKQGVICDTVNDWWQQDTSVHKYPFARTIYREIVSKDYFDKVSNLNKKDNWLILSMAREVEARCDFFGEHVTLIKQLVKEKSASELAKLKFPEKIIDILNDTRNTVFYNDDIVYRSFWGGPSGQGEWLQKFADLICEHFENRVILVHTPPSKQWLSKKHGYYTQLPVYGDFLHIFKNKTRTGKHFDKDSWYDACKNYKGIYVGFRKHMQYNGFRGLKTVDVAWKDLVADEQHRRGKSPFHYTIQSTMNIADEIVKTIEDKFDHEKA
jgi:hypothetical protein